MDNACSQMQQMLHNNRCSGALVCTEVSRAHEHGLTTTGMNWPAPGEEPVVTTSIQVFISVAKVLRSAVEDRKRPPLEQGSGGGGQMHLAQMIAECEEPQYETMEMHGVLVAAWWALGRSKFRTPNCVQSEFALQVAIE